MASILELWNTKYKELTLVDAKALSEVGEPFEIFEFAVIEILLKKLFETNSIESIIF